jgi:hypothetical protein
MRQSVRTYERMPWHIWHLLQIETRASRHHHERGLDYHARLTTAQMAHYARLTQLLVIHLDMKTGWSERHIAFLQPAATPAERP